MEGFRQDFATFRVKGYVFAFHITRNNSKPHQNLRSVVPQMAHRIEPHEKQSRVISKKELDAKFF